MTDQPPEFGRFLLPGPTEVHPDVLAAMARPMIAHRSPEMERLLSFVRGHMQRLFGTRANLLLGTCSGTGYMEMAMRCAVRQRVLCAVNGAFGRRFAAIAEACGREVVTLNVRPGDVFEPDMLREAVARSEVDAVALVHSETSTGALLDIRALAAAAREFKDVMVLVDAVTSVGGLPFEMDDWGVDFAFTASQKALGLPPGLALGACSERLLERARSVEERGNYLDLVTHVEALARSQPTHTPAIPQIFALVRQCERVDEAGGWPVRFERHAAMRQIVEDWVAGEGGDSGWGLLARAGHRSPTVSVLTSPDGVNAHDVVVALRERGWQVGSGYGELRDTTLRIGHMGDHGVGEVQGVLELLGSGERGAGSGTSPRSRLPA